ncbi:hypothetical protein GCM10009617_28220 [Leifsonia poae]|uniref:Uncharacterized protein n=1 Tax=Leifsonia poae TaxID=110933 RepID=A0A9W6H8Y0_9MICO|nr:hypothetical protein GCM10017584_11830 [Leifsonia poae]
MDDIVPAPSEGEPTDPNRSSGGVKAGAVRRPPLLVALAVLMFLEAALVAALAVWLLVDLLTLKPQSFASAVAIVVLVVAAAVWVTGTAIGVLRARGWSRASTVTIQILQIAVAVGSFQGLYAQPALGWALLVPAVVAILLALSPQVVRATTGGAPRPE